MISCSQDLMEAIFWNVGVVASVKRIVVHFVISSLALPFERLSLLT